jgi:hypothetical protein
MDAVGLTDVKFDFFVRLVRGLITEKDTEKVDLGQW